MMSLPVGLMLPALAAQADGVAALDVALLANASATAVLQQWCDARFQSQQKIRAEVAVREMRPANAAQADRLRVDRGAPLSYRRVQLLCGDIVLSEAENWYVAERLTPGMREALAGDTPFGVVVQPLAPSRFTIARERVWAGHGPQQILRHHAVLRNSEGQPISEVVEIYQRAVIGEPLTRG